VADYLKEPTIIKKTLTLAGRGKFLAESLFTGGYSAQGGAVSYQESTYPYMEESKNEPNENFAISEGGDFHTVYMEDVGPQVAKVRKYGIESYVTYEDERRNQLGVLARATTRMLNTMVKHLDGVTMTMLTTNPAIRTFATVNWNDPTSIGIWDDILEATNMIEDEDTAGGVYSPDTLVVSNHTYNRLRQNADIRDLFGERDDNPVFKGSMEELAGLRIMKSQYVAKNTAFALQLGEIGGIADEEPLQMKPVERVERNERIYLRSKRTTIAFLTDPGAIVKFTGLLTS
jgi:hypothetical protein